LKPSAHQDRHILPCPSQNLGGGGGLRGDGGYVIQNHIPQCRCSWPRGENSSVTAWPSVISLFCKLCSRL
jgi:hypothetical protein